MTDTVSGTEIADAAYRLATDGAITQARLWQATLYDTLSHGQEETGKLLLTSTGVGKTEAVVIPALGLQRGGAPRRVFLIGPDSATLDDPLYRLAPYLRNMTAGDDTARTLCVEMAGEDGTLCRRFLPNGLEDPSVETNPLEADVDLVLSTFSRFRALFFGSGGVHALPARLIDTEAQPMRRDLFVFDEAHGYDVHSFSQFHRLAEFLYAEDSDVLVLSTTMSGAYAEELSFLDTETVSATTPPVTLSFLPTDNPLAALESEARRRYYQNGRVFGVTETPADAETLYARLAPSYPHSVYLYHEAQPAEARRRTYAQLRELEKEGEGYLLLTTGAAAEGADLDATVMLTTLAPPENLIRRAGRVNRRGDLPAAELVVVGETFAPAARFLPAQSEYLAALRGESGTAFEASRWKAFI